MQIVVSFMKAVSDFISSALCEKFLGFLLLFVGLVLSRQGKHIEAIEIYAFLLALHSTHRLKG